MRFSPHRGQPHASGLHFPAGPAVSGAGGRGRRCERRRGRRAPGTRAGDHGVRLAGASTLTPGGDCSGGGLGASLERAGPCLREGRKGRGERRREAGRPRAGGQRSAAPNGARGSMRRPRDHGLQDQVSAAGRSRARGRRGWGRAAGRGPRLGDLLPGLEGRPAWRRQAGRGTVAMAMREGSGTGCARGGGARMIRCPLLT